MNTLSFSFIKKDIFKLWGKILIACIPAGVVGVLLDDTVDKYLYNFPCVATALIVFGILFIIVESQKKGDQSRIRDVALLDYKTDYTKPNEEEKLITISNIPAETSGNITVSLAKDTIFDYAGNSCMYY